LSLFLDHTNSNVLKGEITISGSKSESNRLLILQQHFPKLLIKNLSNSDDTQHLEKALKMATTYTAESVTINIGHAGTAMRFLTAFLATQKGQIVQLTGSKRMQERPIKILVDALLDLGAQIDYVKNDGYPPILITGKKLNKNTLSIKGNISSQYISALLLIAPTLPNGLEIHLKGEITSIPYIEMTLALLDRIGVNTSFDSKTIRVQPLKTEITKPQSIFVEPDWSSASYYYSIAALQPNSTIQLNGFKRDSLQGDSVLPEIYNKLGVKTTFTNTGIVLESAQVTLNVKSISLNLKNTPDLAQTIAVSCLGLGVNCHLTGLHTLKIKETDRLQALKNELEKLGAKVQITNNSLDLTASKKINQHIAINTYQDHRMAMAFAPLSVKTPIIINEHEVVSKSYPQFWADLEGLFG